MKNTTQFAAAFSDLYQNNLVTATELSKAQAGLYELRMASVNYVTSDAAGRTQLRSADAAWLKQVDDNIAAYASTPLGDDEQQALQQWQASYPTYV